MHRGLSRHLTPAHALSHVAQNDPSDRYMLSQHTLRAPAGKGPPPSSSKREAAVVASSMPCAFRDGGALPPPASWKREAAEVS